MCKECSGSDKQKDKQTGERDRSAVDVNMRDDVVKQITKLFCREGERDVSLWYTILVLYNTGRRIGGVEEGEIPSSGRAARSERWQYIPVTCRRCRPGCKRLFMSKIVGDSEDPKLCA